MGKRAQEAAAMTGDPNLQKYGQLDGALATQSALLMRIDNLVIAEWTENGKIRIWTDDDVNAPVFYARTYDSDVLRTAEHEFRHSGSTSGTWQEQVARFIRRHTGLMVTYHEYMP